MLLRFSSTIDMCSSVALSFPRKPPDLETSLPKYFGPGRISIFENPSLSSMQRGFFVFCWVPCELSCESLMTQLGDWHTLRWPSLRIDAISGVCTASGLGHVTRQNPVLVRSGGCSSSLQDSLQNSEL